jgi:hypothetical protein
MAVAFIAAAFYFAFSASFALHIVRLVQDGTGYKHTATGTRFLDPLGALLSVSEDGVVRLLG